MDLPECSVICFVLHRATSGLSHFPAKKPGGHGCAPYFRFPEKTTTVPPVASHRTQFCHLVYVAPFL